MDLDSGLYYDYQKLLDTFGQFRGFKELLKIDELFTRLEEFNLFGAKSIVVKLDVPSNISLLGIDDLLCKNRSKPDNDARVRPDAKTEFNRTVKRCSTGH